MYVPLSVSRREQVVEEIALYIPGLLLQAMLKPSTPRPIHQSAHDPYALSTVGAAAVSRGKEDAAELLLLRHMASM